MAIKLTGKETFLGKFEVNKEPFRIGEEKEPQQTSIPDSIPNLDHILNLRLSELSRRNIAIKINSEILNCEPWLCSNEKMSVQIRKDDPAAVIYTVEELRWLYRLNPDPKSLRNSHIAKRVFPGSKIIDSRLKEASDESEDAQND